MTVDAFPVEHVLHKMDTRARTSNDEVLEREELSRNDMDLILATITSRSEIFTVFYKQAVDV